MENKSLSIFRSAFSIKDAGIFLGCLYFISFLVILPIYLRYSNGFITVVRLAFMATLSVVIVHLILNWLYVATTVVPLIMAGVFAGAGLLIWLASPLIIFLSSAFLNSLLNYSIIFSGIEINYELLNIFISRIGSLLTGIGGYLWWAVKKAKNLDYIALGAYVVLFAIYGVLSGIGSLSKITIFLILWYLIYLKVKGRTTDDIIVFFKIVATVAVVFGVYTVEIARLGTSIFTHTLFLNSVEFGTSNGHSAFVLLYKNVLGIFILLGIWKPDIFKNKIPENIKNRINEIIKNSIQFINIK